MREARKCFNIEFCIVHLLHTFEIAGLKNFLRQFGYKEKTSSFFTGPAGVACLPQSAPGQCQSI